MVLMNGGATFVDALKTAWQDPVTKERFFTTPLALQASVRGQKRNFQDPAGLEPTPGARARGGKGKGRGNNKGNGKNGKGNGKSGGKARPGGCAAKTPDGKSICYSYNNTGCTRQNCNFLHVCGKCYRQHPMGECTN